MNYYASEIDKYAIQITQKNFPDTIQLGDIRKVQAGELPKIDLLVAGSPCQDLSFAGKRKGLINGERSNLFFEFIRLYQELRPKYFIVENVKMKKEYQDIISDNLGVQPIEINSNIFSAQNRKRLYWTNIPLDSLPPDKGILLKDILLDDAQEPMLSNIYGGFKEKKPRVHYNKSVTIRTASGGGHIPSVCIKEMLHSQDAIAYMERGNKKWAQAGSRRADGYTQTPDKDKAFALTANFYKGVPYNYFKDTRYDSPNIRKLHPIECERLQTVPDNYTEGVSNTQRFKMIGNGMTVDVIAFLLKNAKGIDNVLSCFDGMSCTQLAIERNKK
ncbi:MAG TPA: hypothetical protein DCM40_09450 [Maribacter sp.]|nr:hypothetical protein [Maribacter sp.]